MACGLKIWVPWLFDISERTNTNHFQELPMPHIARFFSGSRGAMTRKETTSFWGRSFKCMVGSAGRGLYNFFGKFGHGVQRIALDVKGLIDEAASTTSPWNIRQRYHSMLRWYRNPFCSENYPLTCTVRKLATYWKRYPKSCGNISLVYRVVHVGTVCLQTSTWDVQCILVACWACTNVYVELCSSVM